MQRVDERLIDEHCVLHVLPLYVNARHHVARMTKKKNLNSVGLFEPTRHFHQPIISFTDRHKNTLMGKTFSNENHVQEFAENLFVSKLIIFYSKGFEELADK